MEQKQKKIYKAKEARKKLSNYGSGCGSVGRAVASDTRGPQFESSHRQNFINTFTINCIEKTKIKKKEVHLKKRNCQICLSKF